MCGSKSNNWVSMLQTKKMLKMFCSAFRKLFCSWHTHTHKLYMYNINAHIRAQCCQMTGFDVEMTEHALQSGTALGFANNPMQQIAYVCM